ncbi:hypothetical protein [Stenotrophomonas oahuensis]|uniref:HEAT repeat domain-containing protein n=1 Tax=Stenotrophomonas oahuensis TaxID=3003271 RepID=A0ABY9YVA8_9GAMM|nr:hypothetical protein [Stenotrophomonas sp. A5586]WNH54526.1 hypothetical protein PDM29_09705 [Stenotrophomonas sp. A5586]
MDVVALRTRLLGFTALAALAGTAQATVTLPPVSPLLQQTERLHALTGLADAASPENVPDRETLVTAMMVAMDIADPVLVPRADAGPEVLPDLRTACENGHSATVQLVRLAQATPDPGDILSRLSVALDRTTNMQILCAARQLDIESRELLKRGVSPGDAATLDDMRRLLDDLKPRISMLVMGATLTDLNPNSRARTTAEALPVLLEVASAMTPELRKETLDAIDKTLQKHDSEGRIDNEVRARLTEAFRGDACSASCKVLGGAGGTGSVGR